MKIIVESINPGEVDRLLYDNSTEYGLLVIYLDDGTKIRIDQRDGPKGQPFLDLSVQAKNAGDVLKVVPRAANSIWVGADYAWDLAK